MKYAIIETCGRQYKVIEGAKVKIDKVPGEVGQAIEFTRVLSVGGDSQPKIGTPWLANAKVSGEIVAMGRDKKVMVFKKKRRKGYSKHFGHRQHYTEVLIKGITA